jgi:Domain of unknown function (DUF4190)
MGTQAKSYQRVSALVERPTKVALVRNLIRRPLRPDENMVDSKETAMTWQPPDDAPDPGRPGPPEPTPPPAWQASDPAAPGSGGPGSEGTGWAGPASGGPPPDWASQPGAGQYRAGQYGTGVANPYPGGAGAFPPGSGYPPGYPVAAPRARNSMALASLIVSLVGLVSGIAAPIGAILGHVARRQIRQTGEDGEGMALAGIIIGWTLTGVAVVACCVIGAAVVRAGNLSSTY